MKKSELPGVKVHKSLSAAISSVTAEMEKQHFATVNREKAKAVKAKKASPPPPG